MNLTKTFGRQPRSWIFLEMTAFLLLIGVADYAVGYEVRLFPFYAAPVFIVSWFCGKRLGLCAGLIAGILSLGADWLTHDPDLVGWIRIWEVGRHIGSSMVVSLVGTALRNKSDIADARIALLEHTRKLEQKIISITEAEQQRIGQDLHDGLCQYLAALSCSARSLQDDLEVLKLSNEADAAADLADLLQNAVRQTRDLAHGLVPAHVSRMGLPIALESLAASVTRLQQVDCSFDCGQLPSDLDETTAKHLYRIAQGAISNATQHGKAQKISISLESSGPDTTLRIRDNGIGFSEREMNGSGVGLEIMRYRARATGGELHIQQPETGGTLVWCTVRKADATSEAVTLA